MTADVIDGRAFAATLRARVGAAVKGLKKNHGLTPGLAVVLVGADPASEVYVRNKGVATREAGMNSFEFKMPGDVSQDALLAQVYALNEDPSVHGILVQFPVPEHIDQSRVIEAIDPNKDVDGLHPVNAGHLMGGNGLLVPCTPLGCVKLIKNHLKDLSGKRALVLGRSALVGKPLGLLLLNENCTVTLAHSRTLDLADECRRADILVAAVGRPHFVQGDWIKPGAVVIDVGINRVPAPEKGAGKTRLVGDVDYVPACERAAAITPVPGGVGPMTIACLLANTLTAACTQAKLPVPKV